MLKAAILGGLFIGILSALPIVNCCCCLWIICGGLLAAYIDQQNDPRPTTVGRGAGAGALAGIVGAFVWIPASMMLGALMAPIQEGLMAEFIRNAQDMPPEAREWIERLSGPGSAPFRYSMGFVLRFCAGALFATLGGMLGAAFFRNDVPPALGGTYVPPPPPPPTDHM
jgi:hypothetical protein